MLDPAGQSYHAGKSGTTQTPIVPLSYKLVTHWVSSFPPTHKTHKVAWLPTWSKARFLQVALR